MRKATNTGVKEQRGGVNRRGRKAKLRKEMRKMTNRLGSVWKKVKKKKKDLNLILNTPGSTQQVPLGNASNERERGKRG